MSICVFIIRHNNEQIYGEYDRKDEVINLDGEHRKGLVARKAT